MAPLKKNRVRGNRSDADVTAGGSKSFLALEEDDQKDFERRVADHKKKMNAGGGGGGGGTKSGASFSDDGMGSAIPGVVYLGHVPHGFYEKEMRAFFSQFGKVTRLRLSRSKRTGRSKGYAFLEFRHEEVAKVAADTMNNYLMYRQILKCEFVPADKLHPDTFKNCHRPFRMPTAAAESRKRHNADREPEREADKAKNRRNKLKKKMAALKEMGIDYDSCQVEEGVVVAAASTTLKEEEAMDVAAAAVEEMGETGTLMTTTTVIDSSA